MTSNKALRRSLLGNAKSSLLALGKPGLTRRIAQWETFILGFNLVCLVNLTVCP